MVKLIIVVVLVVILLLIFKNSKKNINNFKTDFYKYIIIFLFAGLIIFLLATSGRYILPQLLNIIKIGLPFLTKLIGL